MLRVAVSQKSLNMKQHSLGKLLYLILRLSYQNKHKHTSNSPLNADNRIRPYWFQIMNLQQFPSQHYIPVDGKASFLPFFCLYFMIERFLFLFVAKRYKLTYNNTCQNFYEISWPFTKFFNKLVVVSYIRKVCP